MNFVKTTAPGGVAFLVPVVIIVLVSRGQTSRVGPEVERSAAEHVAVYFAGSPNAWSGVVEIVTAGQVTLLDMPITSVLAHAEGLGRGTEDILAGIGGGGAGARQPATLT